MKKNHLLKSWLAVLAAIGLSEAQAVLLEVPVPLSGGTAGQSTNYNGTFVASLALDGNTGNFTHTAVADTAPKWWVDFPAGEEISLNLLRIHNRDSCCQGRLSDITVDLLDADMNVIETVGPLNVANAEGGPAFLEITFEDVVSGVASIEISRIDSTADTPGVLSLGEVQAFLVQEEYVPPGTNLTNAGIVSLSATQSTTLGNYHGGLALDGNLGNYTHTVATDEDPTWTADLGAEFLLQHLTIHNRDDCCQDRLQDISVRILDGSDSEVFATTGLLNPGNALENPEALTLDLMALNGGSPIIGQKIEIKRTPYDTTSETNPDGIPDDNSAVLSLGEVVIIGGEVGTDSDSDGIADEYEQRYGLTIGSNDSATDLDSDGLSNLEEYQGLGNASFLGGTDPTEADSDSDGLTDGAEVNTHHTSPFLVDTDGDSLSDGDEINLHSSSPLLVDTDADGFPDDVEVAEGSLPNDSNSLPVLTLVTAIDGLLTGDITDPEDDGLETPADFGEGFNWAYLTSSSEATFDNGQGAFNILDNQVGNGEEKWCCDAPPQSLTVRLLEGYSLTHFTLTSSGDSPQRDPRNWFIEGSVDGNTWVQIYPVVGSNDDPSGGGAGLWTARNQTLRFDLPAAVPNATFNWYRYRVEATNSTQHALGELELFGTLDDTDSDSDGLPDWFENNYPFLDPNSAADASQDGDSDGLTNLEEYAGIAGSDFLGGTDPGNADTDGDGANDATEVKTVLSNPFDPDTDGDGLTDGEELNTYSTSPLLADTDEDGFSDSFEIDFGTSPTDGSDVPLHTAISILDGLLGGDFTDPNDNGTEIPAETGSYFDWNTISSSSESFFNGAEGAFNVFDNQVGGGGAKWCCDAAPQWIAMEMYGSYSLTHFTVTSSNDSPQRDPRDWFIEGSTDGVTWEVIYPVANSADDPSGGGAGLWNARNQTLRFDLPSPSPFYQHFRYRVEATNSTQHALGEIELFGTVDNTDTDNDGLPDWYENKYAGLDANNNADAAADGDGDGLSNLAEYGYGSEPEVADFDNDGLNDLGEQTAGTSPFVADSDDDGFSDGLEVARGSSPLDFNEVPTLDPILFGDYQSITGTEADFDTRGQLIHAWNGGAAPVTVFGIPFTPTNLLGATATGLDPWDQRPGSDANYETLIDSGSYGGGTNRIVLEIPNLAVGEEHLIQIWAVDSRANFAGRTYTFETDIDNYVVLEGGNPTADPPRAGEYAVGTFTPTDSSVYLITYGSSTAQYNAIMVRQLTGVVYDPEITGIAHDGNEVTISATGLDAAVTYELRSSPDLATPFAPLTPAVEVTGQAAADFVDPSPAADRRFYQIWQVPAQGN
ncbi:discoidin domain-containing protein [Roseibacillus ishigakijimensis]|uniref:Discoidin domain-containing protein n=1 Tax=Roseibacillus ishigakijimensis TaxID=454146 RepID=A0A934RQ67_9BACT|nr:discoidin domain-containing protein [Roseibacillus ishigakijimensis]MBK1832506.1 discoidin domain-containing protein [Roseibacillus ishigakijimensis]